MDEDHAVVALSALAHPLRLRVFRALVVVGEPGLAAGAIQEGVRTPAATLSFHLKELTQAGLVTQERSGRNVIYRAAYDEMNGLLGYLTENCCAGAACAVGPEASTTAAEGGGSVTPHLLDDRRLPGRPVQRTQAKRRGTVET